MDINRKLELAEQHIHSISRHDEIDMAVREAVLDRVIATIKAERGEMQARVKARAEAALQPPAVVPDVQAAAPAPAPKAKR
jgi:hypothetical protein